jgi:hypothetical protein
VAETEHRKNQRITAQCDAQPRMRRTSALVINVVSSASRALPLLPDSGHIAASRRSATKSADARRRAAHGGGLRQDAGAVASVAADKRGVTGSQPQTLQCTICREGQKPKFIKGFALARPPVIRLLLVIQVPHASDKRSVALLSCPIDGFVLGLEGGEDAAASWSARALLFTFPRHTGDKVSIPPHGNVHHRQVLLN